jgi:hypothetical protein
MRAVCVKVDQTSASEMQLRDACVITLCKSNRTPAARKKMQIATNKAAMLAVR